LAANDSGDSREQAVAAGGSAAEERRVDYQNKYTRGRRKFFWSGRIRRGYDEADPDCGTDAFKAISGRDYARVDVMVRPNGDR